MRKAPPLSLSVKRRRECTFFFSLSFLKSAIVFNIACFSSLSPRGNDETVFNGQLFFVCFLLLPRSAKKADDAAILSRSDPHVGGGQFLFFPFKFFFFISPDPPWKSPAGLLKHAINKQTAARPLIANDGLFVWRFPLWVELQDPSPCRVCVCVCVWGGPADYNHRYEPLRLWMTSPESNIIAINRNKCWSESTRPVRRSGAGGRPAYLLESDPSDQHRVRGESITAYLCCQVGDDRLGFFFISDASPSLFSDILETERQQEIICLAENGPTGICFSPRRPDLSSSSRRDFALERTAITKIWIIQKVFYLFLLLIKLKLLPSRLACG